MAIIDHLKSTGKLFKKFTGEFGIEIETETKKPYDVPAFKYWSHHQDGSLRDFGIEYVLKQPVQYYAEVQAALEEFRDKTKEIKFIKDSISTSVHVHVNVLNETFRTLGNFLTLYALFENILIRYSGPDRLSNLFCLPICDAEETYKNIVMLFKHAENKNYKGLSINENVCKYAACNLASLYQLGSIEIRSFRGETDIERIKNWVSVLYQILDYARGDRDPKQIILGYKDRQARLLDDVFRDYRKEIAHPDELKLMEQNLWYAASIAYSVKNWANLDVVQAAPEFKAKAKDLEAMARQLFNAAFNDLTLADQMHVNHILELQHIAKHGMVVQPNPAPGVEAVFQEALRVEQEQRARRAQAPRLGNMEWAGEDAQPAAINPIEWQRLAGDVAGARAARRDRDA